MKKQFVKNLAVTFLLLGAATAFAFLFFHFGHKHNSANIALFYILALILISLYTDGYFYGITAALFGVVAVNYFFSYPYFKINFTLDGYPVTFIGMLAISLITSAITSSMKRQKHLIAERERKLMEADKEKLRANLLASRVSRSAHAAHQYHRFFFLLFGELHRSFGSRTHRTRFEYKRRFGVALKHGRKSADRHSYLRQHWKSQNIFGVVEEVVSEAIVRLQKRHPDMKVTEQCHDFLMLPLDATLIEQVLINLLENSYIHSKSKEPSDLIIIENPDSVTFTIRDYGSDWMKRSCLLFLKASIPLMLRRT